MKFNDLPNKNLENIADEIIAVLRRNGIGEESILGFWNTLEIGIEVTKRS